MNADDYKKTVPLPLRQSTLLFLVKEDSIVLAMKKRGFGAGRYNGVGGKLEAGETPEQAAVRECQEEIGVTPKDLTKVATLDFYFPLADKAKGWDQKTSVYTAEAWDGEPKESEEMRPEWFPKGELPFINMWPDDPFWLPAVLSGKYVEAEFFFGEGDAVLEWKLAAR